MKPIFFTIPGRPGTKGRPIFGRAGWGPRNGQVVVRTPTKTEQYENLVSILAGQAAAKAGYREPLSGPIGVWVRARFPRPAKSALPDYEVWAEDVREDLDNIFKVCADGMNPKTKSGFMVREGLWNDDRQIVRCLAEKVYVKPGDEPGVDVLIEVLRHRHPTRMAPATTNA